ADLSVPLSARVDPREVNRALADSGADVVIVVPPPDSGLLSTARLLRDGHPVAVVVHLRKTAASAARTTAALADGHGGEPVGLIAVGARRSSGRYLAPGAGT
ncbi:MAG: hypothetical protein ACOC7J_06695, partial [Armatimonadota bacterium]